MRRVILICALALSGCAGGGRSVPALIKALKNPDPAARAEAARRLAEMGPSAAPAVPALLTTLRDRQLPVFSAASDALAGVGAPAQPGLILLAGDPAPWLRCRAVETLGRLPPSEAAIPIFMRALGDHDTCVHDKAVDALGRAGGPAVPSLVASLKSPNPALRRAASDALGRMPAETLERGAFPIIQQFRGKDECLRGEAELLLSEMGRPAAPSLLPFLADPDADLRRRAVVILGRIGDADNEIIAGLVQRLTDSDRLVRLKAAMALGQLGEADARVLPILLVRLSAAKDPPLRRGLVSAIGNIGPDARDAVGTLIGLLNDSDAGVQEEAAESLMDIGTLEAMDAVERHNRSLKK